MLDEKIDKLRKRGGEILQSTVGRLNIVNALTKLLTELQIEGSVMDAISGDIVTHRKATIALNDGRNIEILPFS